MNSTTILFLKGLRILAWLVFIGLLIKAGALVMAFGVSIENPDAAKDLYRGLDLSRYETYSVLNYSILVIYQILLCIFQAYIALFATKLLNENHMEKPISHAVVQVLKKISFAVLGVWIIAILNNIHVALLEKYANIHPEFITIEFIFLAGIVFILAQFFKRSVEMHSKNNSKT